MLPKFKTTAIASLAALAIALTTAAPANAFGRNERKFLQGMAAAVVLGAIIKDANSRAYAQPAPQPAPRPVYREYPRQEPRYYDNDGYRSGYDDRYDRQPRGRVIGSSSSVYSTPAGAAFNSYSYQERRVIQSRLRNYGYYRGGIDGSFGPGTYSAILAYARDTGGERQLGSRGGAFGVYDGLLNG